MAISFIFRIILYTGMLRLSYALLDASETVYISEFPLHWFAAKAYCNLQCNSALASIYDILNQIALIPDYNEIWIGLHKSDTNTTYKWIDNTAFHLDEQTWTENCILLTRNNANYTMDDASCDESHTFMCDSCDGAINKYILGEYDIITQYDAYEFCEETYQTSLASIHSQKDLQEVINLCQIYGNHSCWIDDTDFNYASNLSNYPWSSTQNDAQCAYIYYTGSDWRLSTASCEEDIDSSYTICNKPSILCDNEILILNETDIFSDECNAYFMGDLGHNMILLSETQWVNTQDVHMEIMFMLSSIDGNDGDAGLIFGYSNFQNIGCGYLYVAIALEADSYKLLIGIMMEGKYIKYQNETLPADILSEHNVLNITMTDIHVLSVTINHLLTVTHAFSDNLAQLVRPQDGRSGYFGLITNDMDLTIHYLYVSGVKIHLANAPETIDFTECGYLTHDANIDITETTQFPENASEDDDVYTPYKLHVDTVRSIVGITCFVICCVLLPILVCVVRKKELQKAKKKATKKTEKRYSSELEAEKKKNKELQEKLHKLEENERIHEEPGSPHIKIPGYTSKKPLELDHEQKTDIEAKKPATPATPITPREGVEGIPIIAHESEGYEAGTMTQINSAVRLNLDIPQAAFAVKQNVDQNMDGNNTGDEEENMMDEMLTEVLEMQTSDPNKIHEMNVNNMVNKIQDSSESDSDYMYHKVNKENDEDNNEVQQKNEPKEDKESASSFSISDKEAVKKVNGELHANEEEKDELMIIPQGFVVSKMDVRRNNNDESVSTSDDMNVKM